MERIFRNRVQDLVPMCFCWLHWLMASIHHGSLRPRFSAGKGWSCSRISGSWRRVDGDEHPHLQWWGCCKDLLWWRGNRNVIHLLVSLSSYLHLWSQLVGRDGKSKDISSRNDLLWWVLKELAEVARASDRDASWAFLIKCFECVVKKCQNTLERCLSVGSGRPLRRAGEKEVWA